MLQKEDIQQIRTVVKEEVSTAITTAIKENNKNLVTKEEFNDLVTITRKGFDIVESRFQDLEYQISLRPTMQKIMDWSDKRIHSLELSVQKTKYILRDQWEKLPNQREIHSTLIDRGLID